MRVFRVVTDPFPGLSALAELVDPAHPEDLEELIALRNETDEVARATAIAAISHVPAADRYAGRHAAIVMAPFLWLSASRFSPGTFGVLYTALSLETAIRESAYHAAQIAAASIGAPPAKFPRVAVALDLDDALHTDYRWTRDARLPGGRRFPPHVDPMAFDPIDYTTAQAVGSRLRAAGREGLRYNSVRDDGGECCATFRPAAVRNVDDRARTVEIVWDGAAVRAYNVVQTYAL